MLCCLCMLFSFVAQAQTNSLNAAARQAFDNAQYQQVISMLEPVYQSVDTSRDDTAAINAFQLLASSYAKVGAKEKAYRAFSTYSSLKDAHLQRKRKRMIDSLEASYEMAKKDKEIARQQFMLNKNEARVFKQQIIIWGGVAAFIFISLLSFVSLRNYRKKQDINRKKQEQLKQEQAIEEMKASIEGTMEERKKIALQLQEYVSPAIGQIRHIFEQVEQKDPALQHAPEFSETTNFIQSIEQGIDEMFVTLDTPHFLNRGLAKAQETYIARIPKEHQLKIEFRTSGKETLFAADQQLSLFRIVQELIQNIIKHSGAQNASVVLAYKENELALNIKDNGNGFLASSEISGIGLSNVLQRVKMLHGTMDIQHSEGTDISVSIPLNGKQPSAR